jgi:hypothetical protein
LWESIGRLRRPFLKKDAEAKLRLRRIEDAIRVRGYDLSIGVPPNPLPQGERELPAVVETSMFQLAGIFVAFLLAMTSG